MSKNKFGIPGILFNPTPSPVPGAGVIGGGTAQGGQGNNDLPMSFEAWMQEADLVSFYDELYNSDGSPDKYEYYMWWIDCEYTYEQWMAVPGNTAAEWNEFSNMP
ncbi:MAG: hypothetical protein II191_07035 [Clostridia bacterium]|nr:hypothetical protein [Clostridia bacterium]